MLRGLSVAQYLRSSKFFSKVMGAASRFDADDGSRVPPREGKHDPSRKTLDRNAAKLDVVDCLLERRALRADRQFDTARSIHLYTDGSPVTGEELQGMIMDVVYRSGEGRRATLPGASLFYGAMDAISKSVAMLWAIFLICCPLFEDMAWFLSKVQTVITDGGTEKGNDCTA